MEVLNHISDVIIILCAIATPILAIIEKTQKINWKPLSKIFAFITGQTEFRNEVRGKIEGIENKIEGVENKIDNIKKDQEEKEISDIKEKILAFSRMMRLGHIPTESEFRQIHEIYDIYDKKGYNSYIHTEMEWIMAKENEIKNNLTKKK